MHKNLMPESDQTHDGGKYVCPDCGSTRVQTSEERHNFTYGRGEDKADLEVIVPVHTCSDCDASFLDHVAEDLCHDAVCQHLGVMTPSQIKGLRELYGLKQAKFCHITKLGVATLSRWERGLIIQNQAYDNYLYLLGFTENLDRIRIRGKSGGVPQLTVDDEQRPGYQECSMLRNVPSGSPTFRCYNQYAD